MKDGLFLFQFFSHKVGQSIYNLQTVNEISRFYSNSNDANTELKKKKEEKPPRRQEYGLKKILLIVVRVNELHTASKTK